MCCLDADRLKSPPIPLHQASPGADLERAGQGKFQHARSNWWLATKIGSTRTMGDHAAASELAHCLFRPSNLVLLNYNSA